MVPRMRKNGSSLASKSAISVNCASLRLELFTVRMVMGLPPLLDEVLPLLGQAPHAIGRVGHVAALLELGQRGAETIGVEAVVPLHGEEAVAFGVVRQSGQGDGHAVGAATLYRPHAKRVVLALSAFLLWFRGHGLLDRYQPNVEWISALNPKVANAKFVAIEGFHQQIDQLLAPFGIDNQC